LIFQHVSREHLRIGCSSNMNRLFVIPLSKTNGTLINGRSIVLDQIEFVHHGDIITLGSQGPAQDGIPHKSCEFLVTRVLRSVSTEPSSGDNEVTSTTPNL
jgi:pSer/pThr/pTyr-binding forkhead associated (FHA) protein